MTKPLHTHVDWLPATCDCDHPPKIVFKRPDRCIYCDGKGSGPGGECGFCDKGTPLDTQEDWDATWGRILKEDK